MCGPRYERLPSQSDRLKDTDLINFGKYTDLTYAEVLSQCPDYGKWAEKTCRKKNSQCEMLRRLVRLTQAIKSDTEDREDFSDWSEVSDLKDPDDISVTSGDF